MKFKRLSELLWRVESKEFCISGTWEECQKIIFNFYKNNNYTPM